jgi:NAD(P)-dependent dehydrogenase (short-subunit alcohol dehydrogenase family)
LERRGGKMAEIDLTGKVAIVTGASRGIGRTIALALAERGATVVGTARTMDVSPGTGGTLRETFEVMVAAGGQGFALPVDIAREQGATYLVDRTVKTYGKIDILVNNAGVYPEGKIVETELKAWQDALMVNVTAPFLMCKAALPHMIEEGVGNILNVSSGSAVNYGVGRVVYSTTKAGLERFSEFLAEEVRNNGVAVNAWRPGLIKTDMTEQRGDDPSVVVPSVMWTVTQTPATFTGNTVRRDGFGKDWGPKA